MGRTTLAGRRSAGRWLGGALLTGVLLAGGTVAVAVAGGGRHRRGPGDYAAGSPATPIDIDERAERPGRALSADGGSGESV